MTGCCPHEDRIYATTRDGEPVVDLHPHKGLLRGLRCGERLTFWLAGGALTEAARSGVDLVFDGVGL